jgi:hypothetical protein
VGGSANDLPFTFYPFPNGNRDGTVRIAMGYGLEGQDSISARVKFSLFDTAQSCSGFYSASYPMDASRSFAWGKAVEA